MDETYQIYLNRVARMALSGSRAAQLDRIQPSPKFKTDEGGALVPAPFPGYTIVTPPWRDDPHNDGVYSGLETCEKKLQDAFGANVLAILPPSSFHLTLADLIWDSGYREAAADPAFDDRLCRAVESSFRRHVASDSDDGPLFWQILGTIVMPRAIAVVLAPADERSYDRAIALRRALYQNAELAALGIEQQYHLTAHITLGYFAEVPEDLDREILAASLDECDVALKQLPPFRIDRAELRKFETMVCYEREPNWPVLEF